MICPVLYFFVKILIYFVGLNEDWGLSYWYEQNSFHTEIGYKSRIILNGLGVVMYMFELYFFNRYSF